MRDLGYAAEFAQAFPGIADPIRPESWGQAIGAYERTLLTPAPFDRFLRGTADLSPAARRGLQTFIDTGCAGCHNGVGIGGASFQKFGVVEEYWKATGSADIDEGRFVVSKNSGDKYVFKVPSLRNVAMTPPYFHDGSVASLRKAIVVMARVQLGRVLSDPQLQDIEAFLGSLTGELPGDFATEPVLAPGTAGTQTAQP